MTNILTSTILQGIQQNAAKVVEKCIASAGNYLDTYVSIAKDQTILPLNLAHTQPDGSPLLCT